MDFVVAARTGSTCEVYDVFDGEEVANMTYHAGCVNCLEVSVISSDELVGECRQSRCTVNWGSRRAGQSKGLGEDNLCLRSYEGHRGGVCGVCVGGMNGRDFVVTCSLDKKVRVFSALTEETIYDLPGASCCVYAPTLRNGMRPVLLTGGADGARAYSVPDHVCQKRRALVCKDQTDTFHPRLLRHFALTSKWRSSANALYLMRDAWC